MAFGMTTRELWRNIMHYGRFDRMPVTVVGGWDETRRRWADEGLPSDANLCEHFQGVPRWRQIAVNMEPYPPFEEEIFEETDQYVIKRHPWYGVVEKHIKGRSSVPQFIRAELRTADDWPAFRERLRPDERRIPADLDAQIAAAESSSLPIVIRTVSLMGAIRNWMGVENMCYLMHDAPDVYAEMVDTSAELSCWAIDQIISRMRETPDMALGWEDICGRSGPLVSPRVFERCVAPGYRKVTAKLRAHGITLHAIDTDGDISALAGLWLEAGVNVQFPFEIGVWNADPMSFRQRYGRELRIIGGFNKLALEKGPKEIDAEIARRLPLMTEGGFVLQPDHAITPDTPLANYRYYIERIRELRL